MDMDFAFWTSWNWENPSCQSACNRGRGKLYQHNCGLEMLKSSQRLSSPLPASWLLSLYFLLGARGGSFEHEATRRMRNEFMAAWDGLRSKDSHRILILGATNRPFDLDDAISRSNLIELHKVLEENELSCMDLLHVNTDGLILTKRSKKRKFVI
uniref:ATPase AAA-type core domain-containing protein n=1 Tax=Salix viminalis TaxID=40686 RepID=A0A6N2LLY2_SALVM